MKTLVSTLLLFLTSCSDTRITPRVIISDVNSIAIAGALGYLEGGKAGAIIGASTTEINNLKRLTSAKNPPPKPVNP